MSKTAKYPSDSLTEMSLIVRPADANSVGSCFGGVIMAWMDMAASICARRHCNVRVNTASVQNVVFKRPLKVGHVARVAAKIVRAFRTSMEIHVHVFAEDTYAGDEVLAASAVFILIGLDDDMKPTPVPELMPRTDAEKELWRQAGERRKKQERN